MNSYEYSKFEFLRSDLNAASFGGKLSDEDLIFNRPIVFIHGNGDIAINGDFNTRGYSKVVQKYLAQGYRSSELYATTWGTGNPKDFYDNVHSNEFLNYLRNFIEAVLAYTQADQIDIIAHSMGVTMSRRVIKGGQVED